MARFRATLFAAAVLGAAPVLAAQQPTQPAAAVPPPATVPATHAVKRGDTLWDLAKQYLGDAYLWPEIYRLNTAVIEDPHWIYPGEMLRLPGVVVAQEPPSVSRDRAAPSDTSSSTIFDPRRYRRARQARRGISLLAPHTAVRPGEYLESPWVTAVGGPVGAGVVRSTASSQIVVPRLEQRVLQGREPIFISLPAGSSRAEGQRYLTYSLGEMIPLQGQVVLPTAVIEITGDAGTGDARAVILRRFRSVEEGQGVVAIDSLAPRPDTFPVGVDSGVATRVTSMVDRPIIPQVGSYLILSATAKDGLVPGDQVTLLAPLGPGANGAERRAEEAAVLQVLRVTQYGASAIMLRRSQAEVSVGTPGRITAKMP